MTKPYIVAMTCIFRKEEKYMREWFLWHKHAGVNHFILLCNNTGLPEARAASLAAVPEHMREMVHIKPWDHCQNANKLFGLWQVPKLSSRQHTMDFVWNRQHLALQDALEQARELHVDLLIKADIDEFLVPKAKDEPLADLAQRMAALCDEKGYRGLRIPSYFFGGSGYKTAPDKPVTVAYTRRQEFPENYKDAGWVSKIQHASPSGHHWTYRVGPGFYGSAALFSTLATLTTVGLGATKIIPLWLCFLVSVLITLAVFVTAFFVAQTNTEAQPQKLACIQHYYLKSLQEFVERRDMDMRFTAKQTPEELTEKYRKRDKELDEVTDNRAVELWKEVIRKRS